MTAVALLSDARPTARLSRRRLPGPGKTLVLGFVVLQLAWLLALPPYAGLDEVDHAYRAAGVASGQIAAPPSRAAYGTGAMVRVPRDVVVAAGPQCRALRYTEPVNCELPDGAGASALMPSSAGRYSPLYYAVVGLAGSPFGGYDSLYVMRLASMALCVLFFAAAVWCLGVGAARRFGYVALTLAMTPMVVYSTAVVAPNGVEITAGAALWCALLRLASGSVPLPERVRVVMVAVAAGAVLATVRALGPLWLALVVAAVLAARHRLVSTRLGDVVRSRAGRVATGLVGLAMAGGLGWTLRMHTLEIARDGAPVDLASRIRGGLEQVPLWVLQSMGAFPTRGESAPVLTYACLFAALVALLGVAWRYAVRRERAVLAGIALLGLALPYAITVATFSSYGAAWQGRYALPFTVGLPLLAGQVVDGRVREGTQRLLGLVALPLVVVAQAAAVLLLVERESVLSPLRNSDAWWTLPSTVVVAVAVVGATVMAASATATGVRAQLPGELLEEQADVGHDAARL